MNTETNTAPATPEETVAALAAAMEKMRDEPKFVQIEEDVAGEEIAPTIH
jgi:hypothetical protein